MANIEYRRLKNFTQQHEKLIEQHTVSKDWLGVLNTLKTILVRNGIPYCKFRAIAVAGEPSDPVVRIVFTYTDQNRRGRNVLPKRKRKGLRRN